MSVDSRRFRQACGQFATGVTAATAIDATGEVAAMTVNSFTSVSLEPPQVLLCIGHRSSSFPVMSRAERVAIHVLTDTQEELARRLATAGLSGAERLADVSWSPGPGGEPHLKGVAARLAGSVVNRLDSGDHQIIIIAVDDIDIDDRAGGTLLFHRGRFSAIGSTAPGVPA